MKKCLYLFASSVVLAHPAVAEANDAETAGKAVLVTVTATGLPQQIDRTGQAVTVIGRDEIESVQGADLTRIIQRLPGTTFTRTGPLGSLTLLGVRGAPGGQTLVLIDGVRVNDPANANGEFDLAQLAGGTVESIELLRGSNSVVWGSQAMGGVMNIVTRMESGLSGSIEYGGDDQVTATAAAGYAGDRLEAGITGSFVDNGGFSAASGGTENDGFRHYNLAGRARYALNDRLSLLAHARYSDGRVDLDGFPPPNYTFGDTDATETLQAWSGRVGALYETNALTLNAGFTLADTERNGDDPFFPYRIDGRSERAELFGKVALAGDLALNFGADHEWSRFANAPDKGTMETSSAHAQLGLYRSDLTVVAGLRYEDNSRAGDDWTFGANAVYQFAPGWRVRAAYGEGFKAPTLYQLMSQYGNADLQPERSKTYEAGISYGQRGEPLYAALSAYRRDATQLIDFFSCWGASDPRCATRPFGFYFNEGKTRAQGFELEAGARIAPGLSTQLAYNYADTENRTPGSIYKGNAFGRRPKHMLTGSIDWESGHGLSLGADLRLVGKAWDNNANLARLENYALVDIRASYALNDAIVLFGRVENVWDEDYAIAAGHNTQGRAAFIGVRVKK